MAVERQTSALVSRRRLSGDAVRNQQFPTQILGGYSTDAVNAFMGRVSADLDWLYEQLEAANTRAAQAGEAAQQFSVQPPPQPPVPAVNQTASLRLLQAAQDSADRAVAEAQHRADDTLEHARQQADRIVAEARQHAGVSARQIIDEATADSRRQVARNLALAEKISSGLHRGAMTLHHLLAEWAEEAGPEVTDVVHPEPAEEAAKPAAEEPPAKGTGPQRRQRAQQPAAE